MPRLIAAFVLLGLFAAPVAAEDWPQFRGESGSAVSFDTGLPDHWNLETNLLWKAKLPGPGASSPIILGTRVYVTCYSGYGTDPGNAGNRKNLVRHLICLDRKDGQILWKSDIHSETAETNYGGMMTQHGYASSTPATDGKRVYVFLGTAGVHAFDMDGKPLWKHGVGTGTDQWGSASSVRLFENVVIVNAANESGRVFGLNKDSGEEIWKFKVDGRSWSTPALVETDAGKHELVISSTGRISGLDPAGGKELWHCAGLDDYTCPSVIPGKGIAYVSGARQSEIIAVRCGGSGDVSKSHVLWRSKQVGANVPTPVLYKGHLFGVGDRGGIAYCVDAETGKTDYKQRIPTDEVPARPAAFQPPEGQRGGRGGRRGMRGRGGPGGGFGGGPGGGGLSFYASTAAADDKIFAVSRTSGVFVIAAKPTFDLMARNQFADDAGSFDATPAICDGEIYLRSNGNLYCVGQKK